MLCEPARHHHHAICATCGRVEDVDCAAMEQFAESLRDAARIRARRPRDGIFRTVPRVPMKRLAVLVLALALAAARSSQSTAHSGDTHGKIQVATTISTLNSFVQGVGGEYVSVQNIVPIGASPETFQPAPQDVATVAERNSWSKTARASRRGSTGCCSDAGSRDLHVVVCADGLPVKDLNPHLWMDPVLAKQLRA